MLEPYDDYESDDEEFMTLIPDDYREIKATLLDTSKESIEDRWEQRRDAMASLGDLGEVHPDADNVFKVVFDLKDVILLELLCERTQASSSAHDAVRRMNERLRQEDTNTVAKTFFRKFVNFIFDDVMKQTGTTKSISRQDAVLTLQELVEGNMVRDGKIQTLCSRASFKVEKSSHVRSAVVSLLTTYLENQPQRPKPGTVESVQEALRTLSGDKDPSIREMAKEGATASGVRPTSGIRTGTISFTMAPGLPQGQDGSRRTTLGGVTMKGLGQPSESIKFGLGRKTAPKPARSTGSVNVSMLPKTGLSGGVPPHAPVKPTATFATLSVQPRPELPATGVNRRQSMIRLPPRIPALDNALPQPQPAPAPADDDTVEFSSFSVSLDSDILTAPPLSPDPHSTAPTAAPVPRTIPVVTQSMPVDDPPAAIESASLDSVQSLPRVGSESAVASALERLADSLGLGLTDVQHNAAVDATITAAGFLDHDDAAVSVAAGSVLTALYRAVPTAVDAAMESNRVNQSVRGIAIGLLEPCKVSANFPAMPEHQEGTDFISALKHASNDASLSAVLRDVCTEFSTKSRAEIAPFMSEVAATLVTLVPHPDTRVQMFATLALGALKDRAPDVWGSVSEELTEVDRTIVMRCRGKAVW
ncbi:CLASP N terminal [Carpediemonas membranifera]|uniref:CLASP N terminal n=1 Tax=Carpediemonas membranifera TaxID=201153 RepID=A0A8J6E058_9EUKA|nr:CLASP N terminal [Carpediemonas membranifera]|eukprot:KAG9394614.1 CLASP N terminal [Carpediemonas membranifera]